MERGRFPCWLRSHSLGNRAAAPGLPAPVLLLPPRWPLWAQLGSGRPPRVSSRLGALRPAQSRACAAGESGSVAHRFRAHGVARGQTKASTSTHRLRHLARPQDRSGRRSLHGHLSRAEVSRRSQEAPGLLGSRVVGAIPCPLWHCAFFGSGEASWRCWVVNAPQVTFSQGVGG